MNRQTQRRLHNAGANMTTIKKDDLINLNATVPFTQTQTAGAPVAAEPTLAQRLKRGESPSPFMSYATKPQSAGQAAYNADGFVSNAKAADIMQKAGFKSTTATSTINNAQQKNLNDAKLTAAKILQEQVKGEQKSALTNLFGAVAGAAANFGGAFKSSSLMRDSKNAGLGMGLQGITQSGTLGQTVQSGVTLYDKVGGGQHEADVAKIEGKRQDAAISMMQGLSDQSKSDKDAAKTFAEKAIDFASSLQSTAKAAFDKITG